MNPQTARNQLGLRPDLLGVLVCAGVGGLVFQCWGNGTMGYIQTRSLFAWWWSQWFDPGAATQHGVPVAAVSVWLLWRNLRIHGHETGSAGWAPAAVMVAALVLHLFGFAVQQARVSIVALLLFVWGCLALAGGRGWGRAAVFPLGFLLLAVPFSFADTMGFGLRLWVSEWSVKLAGWLGVGLVRNGTRLFSPDGLIQYDVAAACSGVRSWVALLALALLLGCLGFRSWLPRLVMAAVCLPFVVVGNLARVLLLVLVGERYGAGAVEKIHELSGILVFLAVFGLLLATQALLRKIGFRPAQPSGPPGLQEGRPEARRLSPWMTALVVAMAAFFVIGVLQWLARRPQWHAAGVRLAEDGAAPAELPTFLGTDWAGRDFPVTAAERDILPADTGYSRKIYQAFSDRSQQVLFSIVLSGRDKTSIHRPELCLTGQGWSISDRTVLGLKTSIGDIPVTLLRIEHATKDAQGNPQVIRSLLAYWFVSRDTLAPTHATMQWQDVLHRIRHWRADRWAYIMVQSHVGEDGEAAALTRLRAVVAEVWPSLRHSTVPPDNSPDASKKKD